MRGQAAINVLSTDGASLSVRRIAAGDKPRLLLSHGNGFAIDGYRAFWSLLAQDFEIVLFDLRNHGSSGPTAVEAHTIEAMAADHASVADACQAMFDKRPTFGLFHSVSAIAATLAGSRRSLWDGVVLVDPPLVSGDATDGLACSADEKLAVFARSRAQRFQSVDDLAAAYAAGPGRSWVKGAALDMALAVTRRTPDGAELICPGEYEARIYEQNALTESFAALGAMRDPVAILGADPDAPRALHPALNSRAAAVRYSMPYEAVPGASHMLQIEQPGAAAAALGRLLARLERA